MSASKPQKGKLRALIIVVLAASTVLAALVGGYTLANVLQPATLPVQVEDPIQILQYPSSLSLFPGETAQVNVTVENQASVSYLVTLNYQLNDSAYQTNYVTFSATAYNVAPGTQTLTGWLTVAPQAPAANFVLNIACSRNAQPTPISTTIAPPTSTPTQPVNSTADNSTMAPSLQLLEGGAAWAAPNGTNALYIDWKDCWLAHAQTDGASWGPWPGAMDEWRSGVTQALTNDGFNVTYAGDFPANLTGYNLVVIEAFYAIEPKDAALVRNYVANGGGVVMLGGTPCYFSAYCKDFWPCNVDGTNLTSIADWFGYSGYTNYFGDAYPISDNPLGTSLLASTELFYCSSASASPASVYGSQNSTQVIAQYQPDTSFGFGGLSSGIGMPPMPFQFGSNGGNPPFAFRHEFGAGRVYWQGHIWPF